MKAPSCIMINQPIVLLSLVYEDMEKVPQGGVYFFGKTTIWCPLYLDIVYLDIIYFDGVNFYLQLYSYIFTMNCVVYWLHFCSGVHSLISQ